MAVGDVKIRWSQDKNGWTGIILPMFSVFKDGRQWTLDIIEPDRTPQTSHRFVPVKSVAAGKQLATSILKMRLAQKGGGDD